MGAVCGWITYGLKPKTACTAPGGRSDSSYALVYSLIASVLFVRAEPFYDHIGMLLLHPRLVSWHEIVNARRGTPQWNKRSSQMRL